MSYSSIPFSEAVRTWTRVALQSFGGPAGQIAVMHRILVGEKRWIGEERFLHALSYCMLLPGPEAQQLATYIGWLLHRTRGGLAAGTLFVLPGFLSILALSILYAGFQTLLVVRALFFGIKAAVLAVVIEAVLRIGKRALRTGPMYAIAAADGSISSAESAEIDTIADELGFTRAEALGLRSAWRGKLAVLHDLPKPR